MAAPDPVALLARWWFEALSFLLVCVGGGVAVLGGDTLSALPAAVALLLLLDRVRLRLDNASLGAQLRRERGRGSADAGDGSPRTEPETEAD